MNKTILLVCLLPVQILVGSFEPQISFVVPKVSASSPYLPSNGDAWTENNNSTYSWQFQPTAKDTFTWDTTKVKSGTYSLEVNHTSPATQMAFSVDIGASTDFSSYSVFVFWIYLQRTNFSSYLEVDWGTTGRFSGNKYSFTMGVDVSRWVKVAMPIGGFLPASSPSWSNRRYLWIQVFGLGTQDYTTLYIDGIRWENSIDYYDNAGSVDERILPNLWVFIENNNKIAVKDGTAYQSIYSFTALNGSHQYETIEAEALGFTIYALVWAYNYTRYSFLLDKAKEYATWLIQFQHATKKGFSGYFNNRTKVFDNIANPTYNGWILAGLSFLYHFSRDAALKAVLDDAANFWASTMWDSVNIWFDAGYNMATSSKTEELSWEDMKQGMMMHGMWSYCAFVTHNATIKTIMNAHSNKGLSLKNDRNAFSFSTLQEDNVYMHFGYYSAYFATSNTTYYNTLMDLKTNHLALNMLARNSTLYRGNYFADFVGTQGQDVWAWCISLPLKMVLYELAPDTNLLNLIEIALWDTLPVIRTSNYAFPRFTLTDMKNQQIVGANAFVYATVAMYYSLIYKPSHPYLVSTTKNLTATSYSGNTLSFTISASIGQKSKTQIYVGDKGAPKEVYARNGTLSWNYDSSAEIITVDITHNGAADILIDWRNLGDVNGDNIVDIVDASYVSAHWYPGPPIGPLDYDIVADINYDGAVDISDTAIISAYWTGPPKGPMVP